jgi:hypothetical protein
VPWCEHCAKFWNPSSMQADGSCPACGRVLPPGATRPRTDVVAADRPEGTVDDGSRAEPGDDAPGAPWHFWLMVAAITLYLGWRLLQGIGWVVESVL